MSLSRKEENCVDDDRNIKCAKLHYRILKNRKGITPPDKLGAFLMYGLKTKLNPDGFDPA